MDSSGKKRKRTNRKNSKKPEKPAKEDFGSANATVLLDLFKDIMALESELARGDPMSYSDECKRSKTSCKDSLEAVRKIVQDASPPYEEFEVQFDRHKTPRDDLLHFVQRPTVVKDLGGGTEKRTLFLRTGTYPFISGSITDSSLVDAMARVARVLHHNWMSMEDFEFTEFSIHGTYGDHRENAWVSIKGRRIPKETTQPKEF
jgi:hypothetical protein